MAGLRWVFLLSLLSLASSCHLLIHTCPHKGIGLPKVGHKVGIPIIGVPVGGPKIGVPVKGPVVVPVRVGGLLGSLGLLVGGIRNIVGNAIELLNDILHLSHPVSWDDYINIIISLGRACGLIVDILLPGLGTLLGNLVIAIPRVLFCVEKSPGLIGLILGAKPGLLCRDDYGVRYGWKRYPGPSKDHKDLLRHYGVLNAPEQVNTVWRRLTKGHGNDYLGYTARVLYELILKLAVLVTRNFNAWCKDDFTVVYYVVVSIISVIGSSYREHLGSSIFDEFQSFSVTYFKERGFKDITSYNNEAKNILVPITVNNFNGALQGSNSNNDKQRETGNSNKNKNNENTDTTNNDTENSNKKKSETDDNETTDINIKRIDKNVSETDVDDTTNINKKRTDKNTNENDASDNDNTNKKNSNTDSDSSNNNAGNNNAKAKSGRKTSEYITGSEIDNRSASKSAKDDGSSSDLRTSSSTNTVGADGSQSETVTNTELTQATSVKESQESQASSNVKQFTIQRTVDE